MAHMPRLRMVFLIVATLAGIAGPSSVAFERSERSLQQESGPVYVAYYWRVPPASSPTTTPTSVISDR